MIARGEDGADRAKKVDDTTGEKLEASIAAEYDDVYGEPDWSQAVKGLPPREAIV